MNLEGIKLSEIIPSQQDKHCLIPLTHDVSSSHMVVAENWGQETGSFCLRSVMQKKEVLEICFTV